MTQAAEGTPDHRAQQSVQQAATQEQMLMAQQAASQAQQAMVAQQALRAQQIRNEQMGPPIGRGDGLPLASRGMIASAAILDQQRRQDFIKKFGSTSNRQAVEQIKSPDDTGWTI
jgi:hypothetical protein